MSLEHVGELAPAALAKKLHAITAAADTLLSALDMEGEASLDSMPRQVRNALVESHDEPQLCNEIEGIGHIRSLAQHAEQRARVRVGKDEDDNAVCLSEISGTEKWTNDPINDALDGIGRIWTEILRREIRTAVDSNGVPYGPLIDFSLACLKALNIGKGLGSDAVRSRIERMRRR